MYAAMHRGFLLLAMIWTAPAFAQGVESITVSGDPVHLLGADLDFDRYAVGADQVGME